MSEDVIELNGQSISYFVRVSSRAKYSRLSVYPCGKVVVTLPQRRRLFHNPRALVQEKSQWLLDKLSEFKKRNFHPDIHAQSRRHYLKHKEEARRILTERSYLYAKKHGFEFSAIRIKAMKRQWGSCSSKKNLNFNYKLMFLPERLMDYVVVHELCHLRFLDHSKNFWNEVQSILPDYKERVDELKKY